MANKLKEDTDHKNLIKRGSVWYVKRMVDGEVIVQSTKQTDVGKARLERDRVLNSTYLRDEKERTVAILARVSSVDQQLAKIEDGKPATPIMQGWQTYIDQSNRPDSGESTLRQYEFQYEAFVTWFNENHPQADKDGNPIRWEVRHVTQEDADHYAGHLIKKVSATTFNRHLNLLTLVWRVLDKTARLSVNPWKGIERKRFAIHSRRELTIDELQRVCEAARGEMRLLLALGIYCGLRLGDAACLDWGNVDMGRGIITLIPMKTARRSQKRVTLPIHRTLFSMLAEIPAKRRVGHVMPDMAAAYAKRRDAVCTEVARLFSSVDIKVNAKTQTRSEAKAKGKKKPKNPPKAVKGKRASADCGYHSLRHSFVSLCAAGGVSQSVVQSLVGHGSPAMTQHYTHIGIETAQNAVALLPDLTGAKVSPEHANATEAEIDAMQKTLERMTLAQLQTHSSKVQSMIGKLEDEGASNISSVQ